MSEYLKRASARSATVRSEKIHQNLKEAMLAIQADMHANGGIYPHKGGAVSMAELARRAGFAESNFYKKGQVNQSLKETANLWLETLKKKETVGRKQVKKSIQQRAEDWKEKFHALEQSQILTNLELQSLEARMQKLQAENEALISQLAKHANSNITSIRK